MYLFTAQSQSTESTYKDPTQPQYLSYLNNNSIIAIAYALNSF